MSYKFIKGITLSISVAFCCASEAQVRQESATTIQGKRFEEQVKIPYRIEQREEQVSPTYSTLSCGSPVAIPSGSYDSDSYIAPVINIGYIWSEISASLSVVRSGCNREYRSTLWISGTTLKNPGSTGPVAKINKKVINGCTLSAYDKKENTKNTPNDLIACGAKLQYTYVINGGTQSITRTIENDPGECFYNEGTLPLEQDAEVTTTTGCVYPAENNANTTLGIPSLDYSIASCNGKYLYTWDTVPGATKYQLASGTTPENASIIYDGTGHTKMSSQTSSAPFLKYWVRACTATSCGFYSAPVQPSYYSGCP